MTSDRTTRCLPAEWEPQDAVLLAWPHAATNWKPTLPKVEAVYAQIVKAAIRHATVIIATPEPDRVRRLLANARKNGELRIANDECHGKGATAAVKYSPFAIRHSPFPQNPLILMQVPTNDTWIRDYGPITVTTARGPRLLDFGFNGWGLKYVGYLDNQVTRKMHAANLFGRTPLRSPHLVLEGGSIDSDGQGTILTTSTCLLNPNRNPGLTQQQIQKQLLRLFGAQRLLWLDHGYLEGDDTDAHVDTLARFAPDDTIVYMACDDRTDTHYAGLKAMAKQLKTFRTLSGKPYRLLPLPWPAAKFDENGNRLPATYANFLPLNGAVLAPVYSDARDAAALKVLAKAFPRHDIIGIECTPLIRQHGSLHCVTMQLPKGVMGSINAK